MMILFLTRRFWPGIGGVERHSMEVAKELVEKGNEVVVIAEGDNSNLQCIPPSGGTPPKAVAIYNLQTKDKNFKFEIFRIPVTFSEKLKKFQIWIWLLKNRNLIKEADVVHCHDVFFWYLPFRFLYPRKKVFITFHGWEGIYPPSKKAIFVRKLSEKLSNGNICVGDYIGKWYGTKADEITYGGVNLSQKSKVKSQKFNSKVKIIFIGRLEEDTGLRTYLRAFEKLKKRKIDFEIRFLGDGRLREEAGGFGEVEGFAENVRPYINVADFVFTSGYLSVLEAMAEKRLVFSVYENPLKEDYLKMTPFKNWVIIESGPIKIADKIEFYIENQKESQKLIDSAYRWVCQQSWKKVAETYLKLWMSLRCEAISLPVCEK